jgi:putative transposase
MPRSITVNNYSSEELMPNELWERIKLLLPKEKNKGKGTKGGRPSVDPRSIMNAIFHVLRTGCQWKALPHSLGSGSTAHTYFKKWSNAGVFESIQHLCVDKY